MISYYFSAKSFLSVSFLFSGLLRGELASSSLSHSWDYGQKSGIFDARSRKLDRQWFIFGCRRKFCNISIGIKYEEIDKVGKF